MKDCMDFNRLFLLFFFSVACSLFAQEVHTARVVGGPLWFQVGEEYRILQYRANVRAEPSIDSKSVAILSLNDKIEILEYSEVQEVINGTHGFWIKIKCGNITGYTFSGNIAMASFITELAIIDDNDYWSTKDRVPVSLHFRKSRFWDDIYLPGYYFDIDNMGNELFFYINGQRINTNTLRLFTNIDHIKFEGGRSSILIHFFYYTREVTEKFTYRLSYTGVIDFLDNYGEMYN
jgi:hypothetical protein